MFPAFVAVTMAAASAPPLVAQTAHPSPGIDVAGMDRSVKPGDSFFNYANGTWLKQTDIPADRSSYGASAIVIEREGEKIDLAPPWRRVTLREAIKERSGIDVTEHPSREELAAAMDSEPDPEEGWGKLVDGLLSKEVEPSLMQPTFIVDYPVELSPFAKAHRSEDGLVERWEAFVGGIEIANSFTELNDPDEQRRRFEQQSEEAKRGDEEAQPYDEAFVEALEHGMPPTGGVGLGIDRLVMILTGARSLREVLLFPAMRN